MSFKRFFLIVVLSFTFLKPFAQVSLQTGSAVFSIPMFDWKDDKSRLSSIVAISYSSGNGLKVNDVASFVGQGWNLTAGGAIARLQIGEPDDQQANSGTNSQDISRYPAGRMYATEALSKGCPLALTKYPIYKGMNTLYTQHNLTQEDKQLDYFSFQFNGKTGLFVLDLTNHVGRSLGDTKMKITYNTDVTLVNSGIRTTISSFTIQDVDGVTYVFSKLGLTKVLHADFTDKSLNNIQTQPNFKGNNVYFQSAFENSKLINPYIVSTWYLTQINDALANKHVTFNYDSVRSINTQAGEDISYNQNGDYTIISHKKSITQTPVLTSITYSDNHNVVFHYGASRIDVNGDRLLESVEVKYGTRLLSKYQLNYTYFLGNRYGSPITDEQKRFARLCLRSVRKISVDGKDDSPPYIFDYYLGSSAADDFVPPPFFYAKDIWGFYNGTNSVPYDNNSNQAIPMNTTVYQLNNNQLKGLCFLNSTTGTNVYLNPKLGYAKNGLLKQIIYPTGGSLNYEYEQNTAAFETTTGQTTVGGVHVTKTRLADGGNSNSCANEIITQYNYFMDANKTVSSLWGMEKPVNVTQAASHYNSEQKKYHWTFSCAPFGCCYWNYQYPGILSELEAIDLMGIQKFMNAIGPVLGILTVVSDVVDVLNLIFVSTGVLFWAALIVDIIGGLVTLGITCFSGNNSKDNSYLVYHNTDVNGGNPLPAQYKRVEIIEGTGGIGRTVQGFTSSDQYALWLPSNPNLLSRQRYASWAYGLPLYDSTFDVNGNVIKAIYNNYSWFDTDCNQPPQNVNGNLLLAKNTQVQPNASVGPTCPNKIQRALGLKSVKCLVKKNYSQNSKDWDDPAKYDQDYTLVSSTDMAVDTFDMYTGRVELKTAVETEFNKDDNNKFIQTITSFTYNAYYNYEVNCVTVTKSNGNVSSTYTTYTSDYPSTQNSPLQIMQQHNIVSTPVSSRKTVINPTLSNNELTLEEKVSNFMQTPTGDIETGSIMEQRFAKPTASVNLYSPDNANNSNIYKTIETIYYDSYGNMSGLKDDGGRTITKIHNYTDKFVVATVVNADPAIDKPAYTSFETDDIDGLGGWILNGSAGLTINNGSGITGSRSCQLNGRTLSAILNPNKPYILSCWASSNISVSSGTMVKSGPTISGFTYYEYNIAQGNSSISISGNLNLDELRIYPAMSRMRTVAYDPLIGKTADCDENNRLTYYEYDNLGRLKFIKDQDHNTVKMYEYNNISRQNGCPGTYTNNLVTEYYMKTNCPTGYQGNEVAYFVPAGKYSSTISQEDADQKAEQDLLTNGPSNANTSSGGSCTFIWQSAARSQTFTTENCPDGMIGGTVTYSIPQGRYTSLIDQASADQAAIDEMAANGQAYANSPDHQSCSFNAEPDWNYTDGDPTKCMTINGVVHMFYYAIDINGNSQTYNTHQWMDAGPAAAGSCSSAPNVYVNIGYENIWEDATGQEHGDVVAYFLDASGNKVSVPNVAINYGRSWEYDESQYTATYVDGNNTSRKVLEQNVNVTAPDPTCTPSSPFGHDCMMYFYTIFIMNGNYNIY